MTTPHKSTVSVTPYDRLRAVADDASSHHASWRSDENLLDHIPMHIRQSKITAAEVVGQFGVIQSEEVQHRGVQVVDMHRLLNCLVTKVVGCPINGPSPNPGPCQENREAQ